MPRDFAAKLELTAAALGCGSRKDFCARFHAANPMTPCMLDRLHKWFQGRASPRSSQFYSDWAKVVGSKRPGSWFASCSLDAFLAEICTLHDIDAAALRDVRPFGSVARSSGNEYLCGAYACYSFAWSPYYQGRIVRGTLSVADNRRSVLAMQYSASEAGGAIFYRGEAADAKRELCFATREPESGSQLFFSLIIPGPPASVLCGIMAGSTFLSHEPRPAAGRVVAVRVPDAIAAETSNRYLAPIPGAISRDLMALGLPLPYPEEIDALTLSFLQKAGGEADFEQVTALEHARLAASFDPAYLEMEPFCVTPARAGEVPLDTRSRPNALVET